MPRLTVRRTEDRQAMLIDMQHFAEGIFRSPDRIGLTCEVRSVIDLVESRISVWGGGLNGDEREGVIAIEAGFGPGGMPWEVSFVHGDSRQVRLRWADIHYGPWKSARRRKLTKGQKRKDPPWAIKGRRALPPRRRLSCGSWRFPGGAMLCRWCVWRGKLRSPTRSGGDQCQKLAMTVEPNGLPPVADRLQTLGCNRYRRSLRTAICGFVQIQYIDQPVDFSMGVKRSIERKGHCMNRSNRRTQSVYETWSLLVGLSRNADLPNDVRRLADWWLRHYAYSQKVQSASPGPSETVGEGAVQRRQNAD